MSTAPTRRFTLPARLALEETSAEKHEFYGGIEQTLLLSSIGVEIALRETKERVEFGLEPAEPAAKQ